MCKNTQNRPAIPGGPTWNMPQRSLSRQFLVGIHGCGAQRHQESLTAHLDAEGANNHHGLAQLFPHDIPHTLDKQDFLSCSKDNDTTRLSPSQWQTLFSGCTGQNSDPEPKQACPHAEPTTQTPPDITYDIDSILGFVDSPAAAMHGIRFYSAPQYCQNIRTDVHLTLDRTALNTNGQGSFHHDSKIYHISSSRGSKAPTSSRSIYFFHICRVTMTFTD